MPTAPWTPDQAGWAVQFARSKGVTVITHLPDDITDELAPSRMLLRVDVATYRHRLPEAVMSCSQTRPTAASIPMLRRTHSSTPIKRGRIGSPGGPDDEAGEALAVRLISQSDHGLHVAPRGAVRRGHVRAVGQRLRFLGILLLGAARQHLERTDHDLGLPVPLAPMSSFSHVSASPPGKRLSMLRAAVAAL